MKLAIACFVVAAFAFASGLFSLVTGLHFHKPLLLALTALNWTLCAVNIAAGIWNLHIARHRRELGL